MFFSFTQAWPLWAQQIFYAIVPAVLVLAVVMTSVIILVWYERRWLGFLQHRYGPNRVGPFGLLQLIADAVKMMTKEDIMNRDVHKAMFTMAPIIAMSAAIISWAVIPFGEGQIISNMDMGIFFLFAVAGLGTFATIIAGYASANKWSTLGAMRGVGQAISYEIPLLFSLVPIFLMTGTFNLQEIVLQQQGSWFIWYQPFAFIIFYICMTAEVNRTPFDLPESESELVSGFNTEYSGFKFGGFFMGEYIASLTMCALITLLFFGGWYLPFANVPAIASLHTGMSGYFINPIVFLAKTYFFFGVTVWVRATLPRVTIGMLLSFAWKVLIPLTIVNIFATGLVLYILR
ncbi:NADH-quinone oxidoreductase subunit NuoH [Desulfurispira natronophila]|uniref:NADH-quinone oxidoreductase subunit H n=1 Tax=Desulfurispira natronophila TaxID=682562 RepID=A0A7W7Y5G4_9BACT|nr:NADH-quinone oxidoreductase subunit NuoH [Desulfurispira natronophila]MBB5022453.1 NADH-quinone oxidoreductase subunit H [Desulfurispira natronophila]